jgi:hypothetical protein
MATKFDKLYNVIMEDLNTNDAEEQLHRNVKWYLTGGNSGKNPLAADVMHFYERYKDIIHKYPDLILCILNNPNAIWQTKNEFKDSPFEEVQEWFQENKPYSPSDSLSDEDEEYYRDFTQGEGYPWM